MRIHPGSLLLALALAALTVVFMDDQKALGLSGDPRIDGVIPHVLPDADTSILGNPTPLNSGAARSNTPPASNASRPARGGGARGGGRGSGRGNASAPAAGTEAAPGPAPTADTAPATVPEAATAPAATGAAPATPPTAPTETAPAAPAPTPAPAAPPAL